MSLSGSPPSSPQSSVRLEHWPDRVFYTSICRYFLDVPLDMSGVVASAVQEAQGAWLQVTPGGLVLATDGLYRGAMLIQIEPPAFQAPHVMVLGGAFVARDLPSKGVRLRAEFQELVRVGGSFGVEVNVGYVQYAQAAPGGAWRPQRMYGAPRPAGTEPMSSRPPS